MRPVLSVDIGGVLRIRVNEEEREPKALVEGALEAMALLVQRFGPRDCWIISRQEPEFRPATEAWLAENGLFAQTGFRPENIRFCADRLTKAVIAADLGVTHHIDNRTEVFQYMRRPAALVQHKFLFRPKLVELETPRPAGNLHVTWSWPETVDRIAATLERMS